MCDECCSLSGVPAQREGPVGINLSALCIKWRARPCKYDVSVNELGSSRLGLHARSFAWTDKCRACPAQSWRTHVSSVLAGSAIAQRNAVLLAKLPAPAFLAGAESRQYPRSFCASGQGSLPICRRPSQQKSDNSLTTPVCKAGPLSAALCRARFDVYRLSDTYLPQVLVSITSNARDCARTSGRQHSGGWLGVSGAYNSSFHAASTNIQRDEALAEELKPTPGAVSARQMSH